MARRSNLGVLAVAGLIGGGAYFYSKRKPTLAVAGTGGGQGTGEPEPGYEPTTVYFADDTGPLNPPGIDFDPFDQPPGTPPGPPVNDPEPQPGTFGEPTTPPSQQGDDDDAPPPPPYCAVHQFEHTYEPPIPKWRDRKSYKTPLFQITPALQKCKKWAVYFGVCLKTNHTMGLFDSLSQAQRADVVWHISDADGSAIDFSKWTHPNIWKAQMKGTVRVVGNTLIPSGFVPVTDAYEKSVIDPCPGFVTHWPKPNGGSYKVEAENGQKYNWRPFPSIEVVTTNANMMVQASVTWSGFAVWKLAGNSGGHPQAVVYLDPKVFDDMELMVKVWAAPFGQASPQ